jgi:hypothetical protein
MNVDSELGQALLGVWGICIAVITRWLHARRMVIRMMSDDVDLHGE